MVDSGAAAAEDPRTFGMLTDAEGHPVKLYHGCEAEFEVFDPHLGQEYGIFLTPRRTYASLYGSKLKEVYANLKHPLRVESKAQISARDLTEADIKRLIAQGFDGIIVCAADRPVARADEVIAFHPWQVTQYPKRT